ncbi:MAG: SPFH domain-containing protein [Acidobacteriota bacterium]
MGEDQIFGIVIGLGSLGLLLLLIFIKSNIVICQPNEIVILAGRKRRLPDGSVGGYRVIRGGRGFKWPFIESVARLSLNTINIEMHLPEAMCSGMIPVVVEGEANVKLAGRSEDGMDNAIERFLGKGLDAVIRSSQQTIEGALRGVMATVTPEQANSQRLEIAENVTGKARADLRQLGIVLDFFQIQNITDKQGYLEAIGRKRNAQIKRDAQIAESEAEAESRRVAAERQQMGREAEIQAELTIIERENELAVRRAVLLAKSNRADQKAQVAGDLARAEEEIELERKRVELNTEREKANTVVPAEAGKQAMVLEAEGKSASILEDGRATAEAIELMRAQWKDGNTRDLFLIQMLPELLDKVTRVVSDNLRVERLTVVDSGDGQGLTSHVRNLTNSAVVMLEQLKGVTGIDVLNLKKGSGEDPSGKLPKDLKD